MRRVGSLNRNTPERRRALLDATLALVAAQGVAETSIESVAQRAGVSRGAVYHHFEGREELLGVLVAESLESIHRALGSALAGMGTRYGAETAVRRLVRAYLVWHRDEPARALLVHRALPYDSSEPHVRRALLEQHAFRAQILARFEPFVIDGSLRRLHADVLAALIIGPTRDFVRGWLSERDPRAFKDACRAFPDAAWAAVRA